MNWAWCCWGQLRLPYSRVTTSFMDVTSLKNGKQHIQHTCIMGPQHVKQHLALYLGLQGSIKLQKITRHYLENGIANRVHKNSLFRTYNALLFDETTRLINFLQNYAEQHVILLPVRIPGYKWDNIKLLPSSTSKMVGIIICVGV